MNHYMVLGLKPTADKDEIKKTYRELAKLHHPDRNPDHPLTAAKKMNKITAAHECLMDSSRRKAYDAPWLKVRVPKDVQGPPPPRSSRRDVQQPGFIARLFGAKKVEPLPDYHASFTAGVTCFQYPGGKLAADAEGEFRNAVKAKPDSWDAKYNRALACYWQGNYAEALSLLREFSRKFPGDPVVRDLVDSLTETED